MKIHELKTDPEVFEAVYSRYKNFEIRKSDRDFQIGDALTLRETKSTGEQMKRDPLNHPLVYIGRVAYRVITYILRGPIYGLQDEWVIMSIE